MEVASDRLAAARVLRRRRAVVDVAIWTLFSVPASGLWLFIGHEGPWVFLLLTCLALAAVCMGVRARMTRRIQELDPPTQPVWERPWPDGT
ncbi:MAG: hypothetical protein WCF36_01470 [Candidatus Nanopelagicales bacterium]